jgi:hypothetical protein
VTRSPRGIAAGFCLVLAAPALWIGMSAMLAAEEQSPSARPISAKKPTAADPKWRITRPDPSKTLVEADNSFCLVCHVNLEEEELVDVHLPVGVGCELCHGLSDDHSQDEDSLAPPEVMWPKARINRRCMTCHPRNELFAEKEAARAHRKFFDRLESLDKAKPGEKYCTQCHGKHGIRNRTRIWEKETGKLLKRSGGPAMDR